MCVCVHSKRTVIGIEYNTFLVAIIILFITWLVERLKCRLLE